jgi:hypothetical protein
MGTFQSQHSSTSSEQFERIWDSTEILEISVLSQRGCMLAATLSSREDYLDDLLQRSDHGIIHALAENRRSSESFRTRLLELGGNSARRGLARNSSASPELLELISRQSPHASEIERAFFDNPSMSPELFEALVGHSYLDRDVLAARNVKASASQLEKLAVHSDYSVRAAVANNPNTPVSALERLAVDQLAGVQRNALANPNTPSRLLQRFSSSRFIGIRHGIASNPNAPAEILGSLYEKFDAYGLKLLASNPSSPPALLEELLFRADNSVVLALAINPCLPLNLMRKLSQHEDPWIREEVARNINIASADLIAVLQSFVHQVR